MAPTLCAADNPVSDVVHKGDRLFSIAITPPEAEHGQDFFTLYEQAVDRAVATGIDLPGELAFGWSTAERRTLFGKTRYEDHGNALAVDVMRRKGLPVVVTLMIFETAESRIPADLRALNYDDPKLLQRLHRFIDWVYASTRDLDVRVVVFGNEFDIHLALEDAQNHDRWDELERMVVSVRHYVRSLPRWRETPFALEATYAGLTGESRDRLQRLNRHADVIGVSYYPLQEHTVHEPEIVAEHFATLLDIYSEKDVHFYQFGYPSSPVIGSSLEKQREFIAQSFRLWDQYRHRIKLLTFTWLYDLPTVHIGTVSEATLGTASPAQAFSEFIGSLGLHGRGVDDAKPAFTELNRQLRVRGWAPEP